MLKKLVCLLLIFMCLIPIGVSAEKSYNSTKIFFGEITTDDIVFKAGDKITGGSRISVELYYADASGKVIAEGKGTVKSVVIDGEKVTEWKMTEKSGAYVQLGNMIYQAAYGFTLMPAYAVADSEGYYSLFDKTYHTYSENAGNKKVKFTGIIIDQEKNQIIVSIAENQNVAIITDTVFDVGDKIQCKGTIAGYTIYNSTSIPEIVCDEITIRQYEPLKEGDKGEEVLQMKKRLQALGYFNASAELSDIFNETCVERVKMFQKNNGLSASGTADVETLMILYSDSAKSK